MSSYQVQIGDQLRRIELTEAQRSHNRPGTADVVPDSQQRPSWLLGVDCLAGFLLLGLCFIWLYSLPLFLATAALLLSLTLTVYWRLVARLFTALGPPDRPQVLAIVQAPDRLYCPRCGQDRSDQYCSQCGVNVQREYLRMMRQMARFIVQDTQEQRDYLEVQLQRHIAELAVQQRQEVKERLDALERSYVMEIARQHHLIQELRARRPTALPALPAGIYRIG
jgi:hypothetical protein